MSPYFPIQICLSLKGFHWNDENNHRILWSNSIPCPPPHAHFQPWETKHPEILWTVTFSVLLFLFTGFASKTNPSFQQILSAHRTPYFQWFQTQYGHWSYTKWNKKWKEQSGSINPHNSPSKRLPNDLTRYLPTSCSICIFFLGLSLFNFFFLYHCHSVTSTHISPWHPVYNCGLSGF